jgi:hypothetical protein
VHQPPLYHLAAKHAGGESKYKYASTEVLTVATVKSTVFWDVMPCSLIEVYQCARETHFHHVQAQNVVLETLLL